MRVEKYCSGCDKTKPLRKFHRHSGKSDGLQVWCIECMAGRVKESEAKNKAKWADRDPYAGGE